jgi:hypothetical protein
VQTALPELLKQLPAARPNAEHMNDLTGKD